MTHSSCTADTRPKHRSPSVRRGELPTHGVRAVDSTASSCYQIGVTRVKPIRPKLLKSLNRRDALAVASIALFAGCFAPVGEGADAASPTTRATIGPDGGSVSGADASIWFQPGALQVEAAPTLVPWPVDPPPGYRAVGPGWLASPEGLQFARSVTITLPLSASTVLPGDRLFIFTAPRDAAPSFDLIEGTRLGDTVVGFIWHFSVLLPVTPILPDAGVADAGLPDAGRDAGTADGGALDAGPIANPFDGGCRPSPDWASLRCGIPISTTDGGSCQLTAPCAGSDRAVQCEHGRCECRVGSVVTVALTGFSGSCFSAWNCACGFPSLCPTRGSEPPPGARPGVGEYPVGMRCVDHYDCREDLCWNTGTWACATPCRSGPEPRCPCGKTCESGLGVEICVPQ